MSAARDAGLTYARGNLLLGLGGEAMALYRMDMVGYPLLGDADKWRLLGDLERLAHVVAADFSLWRVCRQAQRGRTVEVYLGVQLADGPAGGVGGALLAGADRSRDGAAGTPARHVDHRDAPGAAGRERATRTRAPEWRAGAAAGPDARAGVAAAPRRPGRRRRAGDRRAVVA